MDLESLLYPMRTLVNGYIALLTALLFYGLLTPKPSLRKPLVFLGTFALCAGSLLVSLVLYDLYALKLAAGIVYLGLFSGLLYRTKLTHRLIAGALFILLLMVSEGTIAALTILLYGASALPQVGSPDASLPLAPLYFLSYTICFGLPTLVVWRKPRQDASLDLTRFLVLPLSQVVSLGGLLYALYLRETLSFPTDAVVIFGCLGFSIAADVIFLRLVDDLIEKKRLEDQQKLQKKHYALLLDQENSMRRLRHDIRNHLMTMRLLLDEDACRAREYLQALTEQFQKSGPTRFCENQVANMVLVGKAAEAAAQQVPFTAQATLSDGVGIEDLDLMSLLSNLTDNALAAAAQTEKPFVEVILQERAGTLMVRVRNAIPPDSIPDLGRTTKADRSAHGLGLKIVGDICRKYNGELVTGREEGVFEVSALLLLP